VPESRGLADGTTLPLGSRSKTAAPGRQSPEAALHENPIYLNSRGLPFRGSRLTAPYAEILAGGLVRAMTNTDTATTTAPTMKGM